MPEKGIDEVKDKALKKQSQKCQWWKIEQQ
jgi:hypothetical protein